MFEVSEEEYSRIYNQTISILRRKRYFTLPKVRAYPPTVKVLQDLIAAGLVVDKTSYKLGPYFSATDALPQTYIVRDIKADSVKVGNYIHQGYTFYSEYNDRWYEAVKGEAKFVGRVKSIEKKYVSKNLLELITFKKTKLVIEFKFADSKMRFSPDVVFNIVRDEL